MLRMCHAPQPKQGMRSLRIELLVVRNPLRGHECPCTAGVHDPGYL
jgi:hypothetical protein